MKRSQTLEQVIANISQQLKGGPDAPTTVMIAGGSATGKSSQVAPEIKRALGVSALPVEQDWYRLGRHFEQKDTSPYRWDDPRNVQIERLAADLRQLRAGQTVTAPSFDVVKVESVGERVLEPRPVLIVEGVYTLYGELQELADHSVYVSMPFYGRFLRRLFRMVFDHGVDKPEIAFRHVFGPVLRAHRDFVTAQAEIADCIIHQPYSVANTIARYNLQPKDIALPSDVDIIWEHEGLNFYGVDEDAAYRLYIAYNNEVYYDFSIAPEDKRLLEGIDYLEH